MKFKNCNIIHTEKNRNNILQELALNVSSSITPGQYELNVYAPNVLKFSTNITVNQTGAFTIHYNETKGEVSIDFMDTITGQQINILNGTIPITGSGLLGNRYIVYTLSLGVWVFVFAKHKNG